MTLAGAFELLVWVVTLAAFRVPEGDEWLGGMRFDAMALKTSIMSRDLWVYGVALLGGYYADRSMNLRMFVFVPLVVVAALLAVIPVMPNSALWPLGIGIGFFLIFGFAAWLAVSPRVCNTRPEHIGTATGLMLTLAAVGGFFVPIIFGHLVSHATFDTGWAFLAVVSAAFAMVGLFGRNPPGANQDCADSQVGIQE
jgi:nitrate/nitrite transporter NarK